MFCPIFQVLLFNQPFIRLSVKGVLGVEYRSWVITTPLRDAREFHLEICHCVVPDHSQAIFLTDKDWEDIWMTRPEQLFYKISPVALLQEKGYLQRREEHVHCEHDIGTLFRRRLILLQLWSCRAHHVELCCLDGEGESHTDTFLAFFIRGAIRNSPEISFKPEAVLVQRSESLQMV